ncbi:hypothetical protein RQP46_006104 [Phenoliferia psychrophenolica]
MATIQSLANETLAHIMDMLKGPPRDWDDTITPRGRYAALLAAALVCSRWRDPAQRALFDQIVIFDSVHIAQSRKLLKSPAWRRYRTRSLCIVGHLDWSQVLEVAEQCNGLCELMSMGGSIPIVWSDLTRPCFSG